MENKKDVIVQNSIKLMYELGYKNCTLRKIAELSEISHVAILKHFGNKHELASILIERYLIGLVSLTERFIEENNELLSQYSFPGILFYWSAHYEFLKRDKKLIKFYTEYYYHDNKAFNDIHNKYAAIIFKNLFNITWAVDNFYQDLNTIALTSVGMKVTNLCCNNEITSYEAITYIINLLFKLADSDERVPYDMVRSFIEQFIDSKNYVKINIYNDFLRI